MIAFQLLNNGVHPYQCVAAGTDELPPTNDEKAKAALYAYGLDARPGIAPIPLSVHGTWPTGIRQLFDRAFQPGKLRPSAAEWRAQAQGILDAKELARCSAAPEDARHIHFLDQPCGRCALDQVRAGNAARALTQRRATTPPATIRARPVATPPGTPAGMPWWMILLILATLAILLVALAR